LKLRRGIRGLELIDIGEEGGDLIAGLGEVIGHGGVLLVAALDLGLEVRDGAVDVADGAGFLGAG
jgi:hypothetical protein